MKIQKGQSLVEILVVTTIVLIVAGISAPFIGTSLHRIKDTQILNHMLGLIAFARSAAVFTHHTTLLCSGAEACSGSPIWTGNLLVLHDYNGNGQIDADEPLLRREQLPDGYTWHWHSFRKLTHMPYEPDGTSKAANGRLTLCRSGQPVEQIVISLSGRTRHQSPDGKARCG
ncbi:GspH/FimT family pseudopilin [Pseudomonas sp. PDM15]|uniref:GspH/FimT family pseudopilin n=1 Tax=Pseudomonas sp. PDM15 TaxID=2769303 RepID=UPI00178331B6|nr:GspH/FimT family pseudopilin [Pseudomonas sp. PDM15]MBD9426801.1 GspH/FimT family pseudopilin [Pseudomonas sp. PDM15]